MQKNLYITNLDEKQTTVLYTVCKNSLNNLRQKTKSVTIRLGIGVVPVPDTVEYCRTKPDVYCIPLHLLQRLQARYLYAEIQIIFGTVYRILANTYTILYIYSLPCMLSC